MIKAALFDLDGVVVDTESQYTVFWGRQCQKYHPEIPHLEQKIKGMTLVQIYDEYFQGLPEVQKEITRALDDFERNMDFTSIPGFEPFIETLRQRGILTAIVTSSNREKMKSLLEKRPEIARWFDAILTSEDFAASKPDPDCYLKAAARLGVAPCDCMGLEDSFNGLKAVRAAGMYTVGLATTNPADAIRPLADVVISDYNDLNVSELLRH